MKKVVWLFVCLLLVTGCGSEELKELNLEKSALVVEETLKNMTDIDKDTLENVYEIDFSLIEEYVMKENEEGDLYAIIRTNNKSALKENMDSYFEKVRDFNTAYSPERVEILDSRLEKEIGEFLIYIVAKDANKIYNDIIHTME